MHYKFGIDRTYQGFIKEPLALVLKGLENDDYVVSYTTGNNVTRNAYNVNYSLF